MKIFNDIAFILLAIGGLNWALVGLANVNLVTLLLGNFPMIVKALYILIGAAAIWSVFTYFGYQDCQNR